MPQQYFQSGEFTLQLFATNSKNYSVVFHSHASAFYDPRTCPALGASVGGACCAALPWLQHLPYLLPLHIEAAQPALCNASVGGETIRHSTGIQARPAGGGTALPAPPAGACAGCRLQTLLAFSCTTTGHLQHLYASSLLIEVLGRIRPGLAPPAQPCSSPWSQRRASDYRCSCRPSSSSQRRPCRRRRPAAWRCRPARACGWCRAASCWQATRQWAGCRMEVRAAGCGTPGWVAGDKTCGAHHSPAPRISEPLTRLRLHACLQSPAHWVLLLPPPACRHSSGSGGAPAASQGGARPCVWRWAGGGGGG